MPGMAKRLEVKVQRKIHLAYVARLNDLEAMGFDLERVIAIAHNVVWNVGTIIPPGDGEPWKNLWAQGHYECSVGLLANAETVRETWERVYNVIPPQVLWPDALQRVRVAVSSHIKSNTERPSLGVLPEVVKNSRPSRRGEP
jgi:hypothetical protein